MCVETRLCSPYRLQSSRRSKRLLPLDAVTVRPGRASRRSACRVFAVPAGYSLAMRLFNWRPLTTEKARETLKRAFRREWIKRFGREDPALFDRMGAMQKAWLLEVPSRITASQYIGTLFTEPRPEPLMDAWATAFDLWERLDPVMYDFGLAAVIKHYDLLAVSRYVPPSRLVADWRSEGTPEPNAWLESKVSAMLRTETPRP